MGLQSQCAGSGPETYRWNRPSDSKSAAGKPTRWNLSGAADWRSGIGLSSLPQKIDRIVRASSTACSASSAPLIRSTTRPMSRLIISCSAFSPVRCGHGSSRCIPRRGLLRRHRRLYAATGRQDLRHGDPGGAARRPGGPEGWRRDRRCRRQALSIDRVIPRQGRSERGSPHSSPAGWSHRTADCDSGSDPAE